MSQNSLFKNWYNYAICVGQGFNYNKAVDSYAENIPIECVLAFYKNFLIPLAYIASGNTNPGGYKTAVYSSIQHILDNTTDFPVKCGNIDDWEELYHRMYNEETDTTINEVMEVFDTLTTGKDWMFVLHKFVLVYVKDPKLSIKQSIIKSWTKYASNLKSVTVWFGYDKNGQSAKDVSMLWNNTTQRLECDYKPSFIYPEDSGILPGGNSIAEIIKLKFYDQDANRIKLVKELVKQSPVYKRLLPSEEVFCVQNGTITKTRVVISDTGENGVPPIEVLKVFHTLPASVSRTYTNEVEAINFHVSSGASVHQTVLDWLHTKEVMSFLSNKLGVRSNDVKAESLHSTAADLNIPLPNKKVLDLGTQKKTTNLVLPKSKGNTELQEKYNKLKQEYDALQKLYNEQLTKIEQYNKSTSDLNTSKQQLEEELSKIKSAYEQEHNSCELLRSKLEDANNVIKQNQHLQMQHKTAVADRYDRLTQNDIYYNALLTLCSEIRNATFERFDFNQKQILKELYPIIVRITAADRRDDPKMLKRELNDWYAGATQDGKEIIAKVINELD